MMLISPLLGLDTITVWLSLAASCSLSLHVPPFFLPVFGPLRFCLVLYAPFVDVVAVISDLLLVYVDCNLVLSRVTFF